MTTVSDEFEEMVSHAEIYPNREFPSSLYFHLDRPNPLYLERFTNDSSVNAIERPDVVQWVDEAIEHYRTIKPKRKWFTYCSTIAVAVSYVSGLIVLNNGFDREAVSYPDRVLYMGMVGLWPDCTDNRKQLWRLISSIFAHAGVSHVGGNLFVMFGLSFLIEMHQDGRVLLPLFLLGTVHGSLSFFYVKPYSYAVGVSQGVFAILGMNIANGLLNRNAFPRLHTGVILYISLLLLFGEAVSYDEANNIAYICHWTSLVSGVLGGLGFLKQYNNSCFGRYLSYGMMGAYAMYTAFWFEHYTFEWPPLQTYTNLFQPVETKSCCFEWFKFHLENPESEFEDFSCPYKTVYGENVPDIMYKS